jgi:uncharacterized protein YbaP (TraB family)
MVVMTCAPIPSPGVLAGLRRSLWFALLLSIGLGSLPLRANETDGLVWQLQGPRGSVFIAGSMHLLRRERPALPAAIVKAYEESESLVMEIDADDIDDQYTAQLMLRLATFADARSLPMITGEARWQKLQTLLARVQVPESFAATLEPWGVAILLTSLEYARLGFDPEIGVEKQLQDLAARDRKPIAGLETPEFQIGLFDALPMDEQLQLLDMTLEDIGEMPDTVDELYAAWRAGDLRALDALLLEGYREMPRLYADLVERRNRNWIAPIKALLEQDGDTFVVVGALHLVGEQGVVAMLEREGLKPVRYPATLH